MSLVDDSESYWNGDCQAKIEEPKLKAYPKVNPNNLKPNVLYVKSYC